MPECSRWGIGASLKDDKVTGQAKRGEKSTAGKKTGDSSRKSTGQVIFVLLVHVGKRGKTFEMPCKSRATLLMGF